MRTLAVITILYLTSCNNTSSPEGRSKLRDERIQQEIDRLKVEHKEIKDSLRMIHKDVDELRIINTRVKRV